MPLVDAVSFVSLGIE